MREDGTRGLSSAFHQNCQTSYNFSILLMPEAWYARARNCSHLGGRRFGSISDGMVSYWCLTGATRFRRKLSRLEGMPGVTCP